MTDRDRLIELIEQAEGLKNNDFPSVEEIADYLLANGVIVPPCKVGDVVYYFVGNEIYHGTIDTFQIDTKENWYIAYCKTDYILTGQIKLAFWEFGESVFLSREEAEAKLEKCKKEGRFWWQK